MKLNLPKSKNKKADKKDIVSDELEANAEKGKGTKTKKMNPLKKMFIKVMRAIVNFELPKIKLPKFKLPKITLPKLKKKEVTKKSSEENGNEENSKKEKKKATKKGLPKLQLPKLKKKDATKKSSEETEVKEDFDEENGNTEDNSKKKNTKKGLPKLQLPKLKKKDTTKNSDKKKGGKKPLIIALAGAVAVVAGVGIYLFVLKPKQENMPNEEVVEPQEPIVYPHTDVVYNTDLWYDDANWSYDKSYYKEFNEACGDVECTLMVTEKLNGATLSFTTSNRGLFESCGDYLCTSSAESNKRYLSYIEITYPDGTVGDKYNAGGYELETTGVWDLISNALYSDMKNNVTDFTDMCATAKKEAMTILNHKSLRENNDYNEVIVYVRSCRYAGKYKY